MGQKVNPTGLRVGVIKDWESRWYADDKDFGAKSGGVYFLSHVFSSSVGYSASLSTMVIWEVLLRMM